MSDVKKSASEEPDRWFLEVKGQVTGPFFGIKILERLLKDEVLVLHRVSRDRQNWKAICNTPFFEELVGERIRAYSGESSGVGQMKPGGDHEEFEVSEIFGLHGATDGITEQLEHARQLEELTANIQKLNWLRKEIIHNRKTVFVEKEDIKDEVHPEDQNVFVPLAPKKTKWQELFKTPNPVYRKRMFILLGVIVVGLSLTQGYSFFTSLGASAEDKAKLKAATDAQASGDYAKAIAAFKGIKGSSLADANFASAKQLLDLADAHIAGKDPKTGQMLLKKAMEMKLTPADAARAHALQSIIASQAGDLQQATVELEASLKLSEIYSTLHNLAILKIKAKKQAEAEPLLLKALEVAGKTPGLDTGATVIALFETAYDLDTKAFADSLKQPAIEGAPPFRMTRLETVAELLDLSKKSSGLKQQLHLASAVTRATLNQLEAFKRAAYELIDMVPSREPSVVHDLDFDLLRWPRLVRFCTDVYKQQPKTDQFGAAFYGACLWRSHAAAQAIPFAKYALSLRRDDPLFVGLAATLLIELNQTEEAKKILFADGKPVTGSKLSAAAFERLGLDPTASHLPANAVPIYPAPAGDAKP